MLLTPVHWQGCYRDGWQDLIVPDAFAHPAKYARGLIHRIYRHLIEQGYVRAGETVLDPFGGVALGALDAMTYGLRYVGVELEPRFVALGEQNLELWRQRYGFTGGTLVQGDSRQIRQVLAGAQVGCVVGSPPYAAETMRNDRDYAEGKLSQAKADGRTAPRATWGHNAGSSGQLNYGTTPGQLGAMPPGAVVSSPPWEHCVASMQASSGFDFGVMAENRTRKHGRSGNPGDLATQARLDSQRLMGRAYGTTPGQLGAMPPGRLACVASPPWQDKLDVDHGRFHPYSGGSGHGEYAPRGLPSITRRSQDYGTSPAQLGNTAGDTFWAASAQIMAELAALLPPGAVCAWVVKAYVKDKQIVPFPDQWRALCEAHGFTLVEEIHASLVEEHGTQEDFFEGAQRVQTSRKSFFRRLCERKGSPRIDHETVLILARQ